MLFILFQWINIVKHSFRSHQQLWQKKKGTLLQWGQSGLALMPPQCLEHFNPTIANKALFALCMLSKKELRMQRKGGWGFRAYAYKRRNRARTASRATHQLPMCVYLMACQEHCYKMILRDMFFD